MPVFLLERFASDFVRPIPFSKVPFFLIFLFPIFCSQSIFVRCQFFTWSCLLPIFSVRFLFLRCHFFLYLFVSYFLFSVHFCKMRVFHLELFPSQFRSDSFFSGAIFLFFLLAIVSSQSMFVRCQFFTAVVCFPFFSQSMPGFLFASHFLVPVHFLPCNFFPWNGLLPIGPVRVISPKVNFILGTHFFPVIGSHTEGFFHASACHLLSSHQGRLLPNLRLATCGCHVLLPRRIFLQISSEPAPATTGSTPIKHVSIQDLALPSAPATFPSGMFPSEPSPCHVRLPVFPRRGFLDVPSGRIGPPKAKWNKYISCGLRVLNWFVVSWFHDVSCFQLGW